MDLKYKLKDIKIRRENDAKTWKHARDQIKNATAMEKESQLKKHLEYIAKVDSQVLGNPTLQKIHRFLEALAEDLKINYKELCVVVESSEKISDELYETVKTVEPTVTLTQELEKNYDKDLKEVLSDMGQEISDLTEKTERMDKDVTEFEKYIKDLHYEVSEFNKRIEKLKSEHGIKEPTIQEPFSEETPETETTETNPQEAIISKVLETNKAIFIPEAKEWLETPQKDRGRKPSYSNKVNGSMSFGEFNNLDPTVMKVIKLRAKKLNKTIWAELENEETPEELEEDSPEDSEMPEDAE